MPYYILNGERAAHVSVVLPLDLLAWLDARGTDLGQSRSRIMRVLLEQARAETTIAPAPSLTVLDKD